MPTNLGALHAKALLFVVALVACSTTGVTTAASTPEGVIRRLHAAYTGNVSDALLSIKRNLRSNAIMTTTDDTNEKEERAPMAFFLDDHILQKLEPTVDASFKDLKLDQIMDGDQLFESEGFEDWFKTFRHENSKSKNEVLHAMRATLTRHFKFKQKFDMSRFLMERLSHSKTWSRQAQKKISHRIAMKLMRYEDQLWISEGETPESIFDGLKIGEFKTDELFKETDTARWIHFVVTYEKDGEPYQTVDAILSKQHDFQDLDKALIEASSDTKWYYFASQLLKQQLKKWNEAKKTAMYVFDFLNPRKSYTERSMRLFVSHWLDYIRYTGASKAQIYRLLRLKIKEYYIQDMLKTKIRNDPLKSWKHEFEKKLDLDPILLEPR